MITSAASTRQASSTFTIKAPDPSNTSGTITVSLPSGWTVTGATISGITGGGMQATYDGSNVVTLTLSNIQVDPSTGTFDLSITGDGPFTQGDVATADESLNGTQTTQTAALQ